MKSRLILWTLVFFMLTPAWMRLAWEFTPKKAMNLMIVDKTVLNTSSVKHRSVNWILDHEKYIKSDSSFYEIDKDYYGFFPGDNENYSTRDFDNMSEDELDSIADQNDALYFTDTYGIFVNEWYRHRDIHEESHSIYGGLSEKDVRMMVKMKERKKLILTEFNMIGMPTPVDVRHNFENSFRIKWTGWMARSITSLDTIDNRDLPMWIVRAYKKTHGNSWTFKNAGMLFIHENGTVAVLEEGKDLKEAIPTIVTDKQNQSRFGVPGTIIYPYWMDIWENQTDSNIIQSSYIINTTPTGLTQLSTLGIPKIFPAIIEHRGNYRFFYFCGDFADNPTKFRFAKLSGITGLKFLMYNAKDQTDRNRFFWEFYLPLMQNILGDYYRELPLVRKLAKIR
ncbi:hypothetical protein BH11BAC1_BH11BAC1_23780 [soil metagenome]